MIPARHEIGAYADVRLDIVRHLGRDGPRRFCKLAVEDAELSAKASEVLRRRLCVEQVT